MSLAEWYTFERAKIPTRRQTGLLLGAVAWGDWYLDLLESHCLPSLLAPENRAVLADSCITLYTDLAGEPRVRKIMRMAWRAGIEVAVHIIPAEVLKAYDRPFLPLAAAQQLLVIRAARAGVPFHQVQPDHCYSERYMPGLRRLGGIHRNIAHGGINIGCPPIPALEDFRGGGTLAIPARALATIGWGHTIMCSMPEMDRMRTEPGQNAGRMPDEHFQVWRARDRVMLFNPYPNPAFAPPHLCQRLDLPEVTTGTLDCHTKGLFGADFYIPTVDDDMAFVAIGDAGQPAGPATNYTTMDGFLARMWREIGGQRDLLPYYLRPTEMAAEIDETAPTAEEVMAQQTALVDMAVERAREAA